MGPILQEGGDESFLTRKSAASQNPGRTSPQPAYGSVLECF